MKYIATVSLLALALFAARASAAGSSNQPSTAKPTAGQPQQSHTDHVKMDGKTAEFAALDVNKHGKLSKLELARHKLGPHFGMLDADKNGALGPIEFAGRKAM